MKARTAATAIVALLIVAAASAAQLPNFDAAADAPRVDLARIGAKVPALTARAPLRLQWDNRFGAPTFVWAGDRQAMPFAAARVSSSIESISRQYLLAYSSLYGLASADVADAYVAGIHDTGRGAIVVKYRQRIGDVEVFRDEVNVVMDQNRDLVALSGHIAALPRSGRIATNALAVTPFLLTPAEAIRRAYSDATGGAQSIDIDEIQFRGNAEGAYQLYAQGSHEPVRVKRVYFHLPDHFEPAFYLELAVDGAQQPGDIYGYVISALDGHLLFRNSLVAEDSTPVPIAYRVWAATEGAHLPMSGPQGYDGTPDPTAEADGYQPTFIPPNLITLPYGPISTRDRWLPDGVTETIGNNVEAYADLVAPDGFNGVDVHASMSSAGVFDRVYDVTQKPSVSTDQRMAAIAQLFYDLNLLHDWYYDSGFNEAAGNAQTDNYGRGGLANDSMRAEAEDYSGRNNANMFTPSDGARPRMQMYVFDGSGNRYLHVDKPATIARNYAAGTAEFGPQTFQISGDVVAVTPADGCSALTASVGGKIAFVNRGTCNFSLKARNAQTAGAIAVVIGNVASSSSPDTAPNMICPDVCTPDEVSAPPSMLLNLSDANGLRAQLASGVHVTLYREPAVDRDGTIDNQVVAHEWMHYVSNRLIGDGNGLSNNQSAGMGEGWSDFNALLMTVRPDDTRFASNTTFNGTYAIAVYVTTGGTNGPNLNNGVYYGIRRVPYSTDMLRDPLTFKHVGNKVAITGATLRFGADGSENAEVHNTGEVWTTMLWEAYASLLRDTLGNSPRLTFAEAQQRMKDYLIASLRITPPNPTFLEARDALLAAAYARDKTDYEEFWQAFAKRGAGVSAVAPDRYSFANLGGIEDFAAGGGMRIESVTFDDSITSCQRDGILNGGESGVMKISLRNTGSVRLQSTTLTVASSDSRLTYGNGGVADVPPSNPGESVLASLNASLVAGVTSLLQPDISITISDPQFTGGNIKSTYLARLNTTDDPKESSSDDAESPTTAWTLAGFGPAQWARAEITPRDHRWIATEPDATTDQCLISPPLVLAPTGSFSFSFRHRYGFDFFRDLAVDIYIDGGVLEISTDGGKTWSDIGDKILTSTAGYGAGRILAQNGSTLEGRVAFEGVSPGFKSDLPSTSPFVTTTVDLGSAYNGKKVQIRFRFATAADHAGNLMMGWEIDDIVFNNITNLPFATVVGDRGVCGVTSSTTTLASSASSVLTGQPVALTATVAATGLTGGSVDFLDNSALIGTSKLENDVARFTTTALGAGSHSLTATFNGGKNVAVSTSMPTSVLVTSPARRRAVHP